MRELRAGQVAWADLNPTKGSEQRGHRPVVVVCSDEYLATVPNVVVVVPVTTTDRGHIHHVRLEGSHGLPMDDSFAMTEQPRTIDRRRITDVAGQLSRDTLADIRSCLARFLDLG